LATYSGAFPVANTWYAFEFEVAINNTTGSFKVRKDGNTSNDFSATSLNTRVSANNYANKLQLGLNLNSGAQNIDDLFWRSDASSVAWMGDIRCYTRMPASDSSVTFSRTSTGVLTQTVPAVASNTVAISNTSARFTAVTASATGIITGVGISINTGNSGNMKCAIYADGGGLPAAVLASATAVVTPVATGTNSFTFSPGVTVTKGVQYWVAVISDTASGLHNILTGTTSLAATATMTYAAFPQSSPIASSPVNQIQVAWTFGSTPANWMPVSEAQQDTTTSYVYDSTVNDADFYTIAAISGSTPSSVVAVTTRAYMQKSDAGSRTAAVQLKSGSTTVASPTITLTTSGWQWAWRTDIVDPNTSSAWLAANVDSVTCGPKVIS
jgi:hypothetical protein